MILATGQDAALQQFQRADQIWWLGHLTAKTGFIREAGRCVVMLAQTSPSVQWYWCCSIPSASSRALATPARQAFRLKSGEVLTFLPQAIFARVPNPAKNKAEAAGQRASLAPFRALPVALQATCRLPGDDCEQQVIRHHAANARDGLTPEPIVKRSRSISDSVPKPLLRNSDGQPARPSRRVASRRSSNSSPFFGGCAHLMPASTWAISAWRLGDRARQYGGRLCIVAQHRAKVDRRARQPVHGDAQHLFQSREGSMDREWSNGMEWTNGTGRME